MKPFCKHGGIKGVIVTKALSILKEHLGATHTPSSRARRTALWPGLG